MHKSAHYLQQHITNQTQNMHAFTKNMYKSKFRTSFISTCCLALLCCTMGVGCGPTLEQDLKSLCTTAEQSGPDHPGAKVALIAQVYAEFTPKTKQARALIADMTQRPPEQMYSSTLERLEGMEGAPKGWSCPRLKELEEKARADQESKARAIQEAMCKELDGTLDDIAYVLAPLFVEEIKSIISDTLPEEKQADAQRIFKQEHDVKSKMADAQPDTSLLQTKKKIQELAGCGDIPKPEDSCNQIEQLISQLPNNRRVVIVGEAYGEALMQLGLDPSKYSSPLQDRLIKLAKTELVVRMKPVVDKLGSDLGCTFK